MLKKKYKKRIEETRKAFEKFDFSKYGRELTEEELYLVNGGSNIMTEADQQKASEFLKNGDMEAYNNLINSYNNNNNNNNNGGSDYNAGAGSGSNDSNGGSDDSGGGNKDSNPGHGNYPNGYQGPQDKDISLKSKQINTVLNDDIRTSLTAKNTKNDISLKIKAIVDKLSEIGDIVSERNKTGKSKVITIQTIMDNLKNNESELDKELLNIFVDEMRKLVGAKYKLGSKTSKEVDCSGTIVVALNNAFGLKLTSYITKQMVAGQCPYVKMNKTVDSSKQGDPGMLNFYAWDSSIGIEHVNTGVGQKEGEPCNQVVDATEGDWMTGRNINPNQIIPALPGSVNQTYIPYTTTYTPTCQGGINWTFIKEQMWPGLFSKRDVN